MALSLFEAFRYDSGSEFIDRAVRMNLEFENPFGRYRAEVLWSRYALKYSVFGEI